MILGYHIALSDSTTSSMPAAADRASLAKMLSEATAAHSHTTAVDALCRAVQIYAGTAGHLMPAGV
jgi:hypothetical protein